MSIILWYLVWPWVCMYYILFAKEVFNNEWPLGCHGMETSVIKSIKYEMNAIKAIMLKN